MSVRASEGWVARYMNVPYDDINYSLADPTLTGRHIMKRSAKQWDTKCVFRIP
jgi:hypothetical protein